MSLFKNNKNKRPLFGNNIELSCEHCMNAFINEAGCFCGAKCSVVKGKCKRYVYDPLLREPRGINIKKEAFTEEQFII